MNVYVDDVNHWFIYPFQCTTFDKESANTYIIAYFAELVNIWYNNMQKINKIREDGRYLDSKWLYVSFSGPLWGACPSLSPSNEPYNHFELNI